MSKKIILGIIGLIILILAGAGGFYLYKSNSTEDWKTYHDEEYGFEFKYPLNWNLRNSENNSAVRIFVINSPLEQGKIITSRVFKTRIHKSLQDLNDAIINDAKMVGVENSNIKIIGSDRIRYDFKGDDQYGHGLHILASTFEIELGIITTFKVSEAETGKIFDNMVSTFKFTK